MNLQPEAKKEFLRIASGVALCTSAMWVVFAALHLVGLAPFDSTVVLGGLAGSAVALGNFYGICVMVQKATAEQDEGRRKMILRLSYNSRMLLQAGWVIVAILAPCFQFVAGIAPLLFPRVTIYYLQITGRYRPERPAAPPAEEDGEDPEAPAEGSAAEDDGRPLEEGGET